MGIVNDVQVLTGQKDAYEKEKTLRKKVLIVEDEKPLLDALSDRIKDEGFETIKAENGKEGLALAIANKPNIIVLDLLMPVMDGKAMLKRLREIPQFKGTPVIILTNAGEADNVRETLTLLDAADFLVKSNVSMEDIVQKIKEKI
jgi:DNA-binding response OmpR family regulator